LGSWRWFATFDKALKDRDNGLLAKTCDFIAQNETPETLRETRRVKPHPFLMPPA
jgi:hypothetical protein